MASKQFFEIWFSFERLCQSLAGATAGLPRVQRCKIQDLQKTANEGKLREQLLALVQEEEIRATSLDQERTDLQARLALGSTSLAEGNQELELAVALVAQLAEKESRIANIVSRRDRVRNLQQKRLSLELNDEKRLLASRCSFSIPPSEEAVDQFPTEHGQFSHVNDMGPVVSPVHSALAHRQSQQQVRSSSAGTGGGAFPGARPKPPFLTSLTLLSLFCLVASGVAAPTSLPFGLWFMIDASNPKSYPGTGLVISDIINGHSLTMTGSYSFDDGALTGGIKAINFNPGVYSSSAPFNPAISSRTLNMWINMMDNSVIGGGFGFVTDNIDNFESIVWNEQGAGWLFGSSSFARSGGFSGQGGGTAPNGVWTMITAVYSVAAYTMYQNGQQILNYANPGWLQTFSSPTSSITLGRRTTQHVTSSLVAKIGSAYIWDRALSAAEVQQVYAATLPSYIAALPVTYYPASSYPSGFTLTAGNLVGVVSLPSSYTVSFDLFVNSLPTDPSAWSILRLTVNGGQDNLRLPGMWMYPSGTASLSYVNGGYDNVVFSGPFPSGAWCSVTVSIDLLVKSMFWMSSGGVTISQYKALSTPQQVTWPDVQVYASFPSFTAVAGKIRNLAIFSGAPPLPASYYPASNPSYASGFTLSKGNLVGVVSLPASYTLSFDLFPTADGTVYRSIARLSATNTDYIGAGAAIPGVWFCMTPDCPGLALHVTHLGSGTGASSYRVINTAQALPLNTWSTILITIDAIALFMTLGVTGGVTIPTMSVAFATPAQTTWPSVQVYAADPWYDAAAAKIRNLVIAPPAALPVSYYPASSYPTGFTIYEGNLVGVVSLPAAYTVSFDLFPTADGTTWRNIVQLTATGNNNAARLPAIEFCAGGSGYSSTLALCVSYVSSGQQLTRSPAKPLPLNAWSTVLVAIDTITLTMTASVSGATVAGFFVTPSQQTWPSVQIYASLPLYQDFAAAKIRNLAISTTPEISISFDGSASNQGYFAGTPTVVGSLTYSASQDGNGQAAYFNNVNPATSFPANYVLVPNPVGWGPLTVTFRMKPDSTEYQTVVSLCAADQPQVGNAGELLQLDFNGKFVVAAALPSAAPAPWSVLLTEGSITANAWHRIAVTISASFVVTLYVNGLQVGQQTGTGTPAASRYAQWLIGGSSDGQRAFQGFVDEFRVYSYVMSASQIADAVPLPASYYPASNPSYASGFTLAQGNLVGVVSLPAVYTVSFELMPFSYPSPSGSVVHLTANGQLMTGAGCSLPRTEMGNNLAALFTASGNTHENQVDLAIGSPPLNQWTTVVFTADSVNLLMTLTGSGGVSTPTMSRSFVTPAQQTWLVVQVYAGDPWIAAANAKIRSLAIYEGLPAPTSMPSPQPSPAPTVKPSSVPTPRPTGRPTGQPTRRPTHQPSGQPTRRPSSQPTRQPSGQPSRQPSHQPTRQPSGQPTRQPSRQPTQQPTNEPTSQPSKQPSCQPTSLPSNQPSALPTAQPSARPTSLPSRLPSSLPTQQPSAQPTSVPTSAPTLDCKARGSIIAAFVVAAVLGTAAATGAGTAAGSPAIGSLAVQELMNHLSLDLPEAPGDGGDSPKAVDAKHYSYVLIGDLRWVGVWLRIPWGLQFKGDYGADLLGADPDKCMRCDRRSKPSGDDTTTTSESEDGDSVLGKCARVCSNVFCGYHKEKKQQQQQQHTTLQPQQEPDSPPPPLPGLVQAVPRGQCILSTPFVQVFVALPGFCCSSVAAAAAAPAPAQAPPQETTTTTMNPMYNRGPSAAELELELTRLRALNSDNNQSVETLRARAALQQQQLNSVATAIHRELGNVATLSTRVGQLEKSLEQSVQSWAAAETEHHETVVNVRRASVAALSVGHAPVSMQPQALRRLSLAVSAMDIGSQRDDGIAPAVAAAAARGPQLHQASTLPA